MRVASLGTDILHPLPCDSPHIAAVWQEMVTAALVTLIRSFTLPGESVLDPFAGSGSSCAAALPTGRKYIGMEMDEKLNFQKLLGSFWRIFPRLLAHLVCDSGPASDGHAPVPACMCLKANFSGSTSLRRPSEL